jgi:hypothetical protein
MITLVHTFSRLARPAIYFWRTEKAGNLIAPLTDDRTTG